MHKCALIHSNVFVVFVGGIGIVSYRKFYALIYINNSRAINHQMQTFMAEIQNGVRSTSNGESKIWLVIPRTEPLSAFHRSKIMVIYCVMNDSLFTTRYHFTVFPFSFLDSFHFFFRSCLVAFRFFKPIVSFTFIHYSNFWRMEFNGKRNGLVLL